MSETLAVLPPAVRPLVERPAGALRRLGDRLSDRLNPILVREVRQALNSRGFLVTAGLALLATVMIALGVAWRGQHATGMGGQVFVTALQVLVPILLFIVPLQAFLSMRHEVTAGTVEQLLMSKLTPGQIVRGKLGAAVVQFVLYLSIFAPLLTMTFLLRGVDVPTIAYMIVMALLSGVAACSIAVACGALSRWPAIFRVLPMAVVLFGLGGMAFAMIGVVDEITNELSSIFAEEEFWWATTSFVLVLAAGTYLFGLVGAGALAHPYENRSTPFRLFAIVGSLLGFGWLTWMAKQSWAHGFDAEMFQGYTLSLGFSLAIFTLIASTEDPRLSPRVRTRVPRSRLLALLAVPLLPGAGRGLLFSLLLAGLAFGGTAVAVAWLKLGGWDARMQPVVVLVWLYVLFYSGLGTFVRSRMGPGSRASWIARGVPILVLLLSIVVPLLIEAFAQQTGRSGWEAYDILNPFETLDGRGSRSMRGAQIAILGTLTAVMIAVLCMPAMVRGVVEVLRASKERRARGG